jgi:hypothetical protein
MSEPLVKQIVLASRPKGLPTRESFRLKTVPMPKLPQGGLLLRVLYLSLDPYMRGRMDDRESYAKPLGIGEVNDWGKRVRGDRVRSGRLCGRRYRIGSDRLAHARSTAQRGAAQARSGCGTDHYRTGRARHAWFRLCRSQPRVIARRVPKNIEF